MSFINGYCSIRNNRILKGDGLLFEKADADRPAFLQAAYSFLNPDYPKFYKMNALSQLGILAAEVLLKDRKLAETYGPEEIGIVLSNAHASIDADTDYLETMDEIPSPSLFVYTLPNIVSGEICIRHRIKGENAFLVFEKFDAAFMSDYVETVLTSGFTRCCLAGWIDADKDSYDVFLYLVEKQKAGSGLEHTAENLIKLYISE